MEMAADIDHAYWPIGPIGKPTEFHICYPIMIMKYSKFPQACEGFIAFMMEAEQLNTWVEKSVGYLTPGLKAYEKNPIWTADPKLTVCRDVAERTLTAGGLGSVGEKAAAALADFIVLDMFANYCTGRDDVKGAMACRGTAGQADLSLVIRRRAALRAPPACSFSPEESGALTG